MATRAPNTNAYLREYEALGLQVGYNRLANEIWKVGPVYWEKSIDQRPWTETDDARLIALMEERMGACKEKPMLRALTIYADDNGYDPLVELFESFSWDGSPRAETLLIDYMGAEDCPYTRTVTRILLSSIVKRVFHPGCKCDHMLILVGQGGVGKSTWVRGLAVKSTYFCDSIANITDVKANGELLRGKLVVELPELAGMSRRDIDGVKAAITRQTDEFRGAYCRRTGSFPRRAVYVGTTNEVDFIAEGNAGGQRRFLPVLCGVTKPAKSVFSPSFSTDVRQAYAEVREWERTGDERFSVVLSPEMESEARNVRDGFTEESPLHQKVEKFLSEHKDQQVCTFAVIDALGLQRSDQTCKEISRAISTVGKGWQPHGKRQCPPYGKQKCWYYPGAD